MLDFTVAAQNWNMCVSLSPGNVDRDSLGFNFCPGCWGLVDLKYMKKIEVIPFTFFQYEYLIHEGDTAYGTRMPEESNKHDQILNLSRCGSSKKQKAAEMLRHCSRLLF